MTEFPLLYVCGKQQASRVLLHDDLRWVVSIGDRRSTPPLHLGDRSDVTVLRLLFDDVERSLPHHGYEPCTVAQVQELIDFAERMRDADEDGSLLVHCEMGISRSTASAIVVLTAMAGPGSEYPAIRHLCGLPGAQFFQPNRRVLWFADSLLSRRGALVRAYRHGFGMQAENSPDFGEGTP